MSLVMRIVAVFEHLERKDFEKRPGSSAEAFLIKDGMLLEGWRHGTDRAFPVGDDASEII